MYIIELYGLPGCGKTTLFKNVLRALRCDGYKVENLQEKPLRYSRLERKMCELALKLDKDSRYLRKSARKIYEKGLPDAKNYWVERIIQACYLAKRAEKQGLEIALFDEGCLQFLTSIAHEDELGESEKSFFKEVYEFLYKGRNTLIINCEIEKEESVRRMKERNRPGERFLFGTDEEILNRMRIKEENLKEASLMFPKEDVFSIKMDSRDYMTELEKIVKNRIYNA